jgi:hypothetical protein
VTPAADHLVLHSRLATERSRSCILVPQHLIPVRVYRCAGQQALLALRIASSLAWELSTRAQAGTAARRFGT